MQITLNHLYVVCIFRHFEVILNTRMCANTWVVCILCTSPTRNVVLSCSSLKPVQPASKKSRTSGVEQFSCNGDAVAADVGIFGLDDERNGLKG